MTPNAALGQDVGPCRVRRSGAKNQNERKHAGTLQAAEEGGQIVHVLVGPVLAMRMTVLTENLAKRRGAAVVQQGIALADSQQRWWIKSQLAALVPNSNFFVAGRGI